MNARPAKRTSQADSSYPAGDELTFTPPDDAIAPWALGFVHRHDRRCGRVVFELPELRPSIQIMLADDYWLRSRSDDDSWTPVPRIALWGPRLTWGYGFAREVVHAFGIGLTPRGLEGLTGRTIPHFVDRVVDLASVCPQAAHELEAIVSKGTADDWRVKSGALLARLIAAGPHSSEDLDRSLPHLVEGEADAIRRASEAAGFGDRQFRRLFRSRYGLSPRLYRRILRIDRLLRQLHPNPWEEDAYRPDLNFADQAHMIREFKALTGITPGEYVRSKRRHGDATIRSVVAEGIQPPAP